MRISLVLANAVLLGAILACVLRPVQSPPMPQAERRQLAPVDRALPELPAKPQIRPDSAKRLFGGMKKRNPSAAPQAANPPIAPSPLRLVGVILGTPRHLALIEYQGLQRRVRVGDRISEWKIEAIESRSVELLRGDESLRLVLDEHKI